MYSSDEIQRAADALNFALNRYPHLALEGQSMADLTKTVRLNGFNAKNTKAGTVYEVTAESGEKFSTWDADLAKKLRALDGGVVELVYYEKPAKGDYPPNLMVKDVHEAEAGATPAPPTTTEATGSGGGQSGGNYWKPRDPEELASIRRGNAVNAAAQVLTGVENASAADVIEIASQLERYITTGETSAEVF